MFPHVPDSLIAVTWEELAKTGQVPVCMNGDQNSVYFMRCGILQTKPTAKKLSSSENREHKTVFVKNADATTGGVISSDSKAFKDVQNEMNTKEKLLTAKTLPSAAIRTCKSKSNMVNDDNEVAVNSSIPSRECETVDDVSPPVIIEPQTIIIKATGRRGGKDGGKLSKDVITKSAKFPSPRKNFETTEQATIVSRRKLTVPKRIIKESNNADATSDNIENISDSANRQNTYNTPVFEGYTPSNTCHTDLETDAEQEKDPLPNLNSVERPKISFAGVYNLCDSDEDLIETPSYCNSPTQQILERPLGKYVRGSGRAGTKRKHSKTIDIIESSAKKVAFID